MYALIHRHPRQHGSKMHKRLSVRFVEINEGVPNEYKYSVDTVAGDKFRMIYVHVKCNLIHNPILRDYLRKL